MVSTHLTRHFRPLIFACAMGAFIVPQSASAGFEWVPAQPKVEPRVEQQTTPQRQNTVIFSNADDTETNTEPSMVPLPLEPVVTMEPKPTPAPSTTGQLKTIDLLAEPSTPIMVKEPMVEKVMTAPQPIQTAPMQPKIVMPDDAPLSARSSNTVNVETQSEPKVSTPVKAAEPVLNDTIDNTLAVGFGTDMPLAIALSQIIPAHYAYSFEPGVNPGTKVSWNGGKPWADVVTEMLSSLNLTAVIGRKSVRVQTAGASRAPGKVSAVTVPEAIKSNAKKIEMTMKIDDDQPAEIATTPLPVISTVDSLPLIAPEKVMKEKAPEATGKAINLRNMEIEMPQKQLIATTKGRALIQDPGESEGFQAVQAVEHIEKITLDTYNKTTEELNKSALVLSEKKSLKITPNPVLRDPDTGSDIYDKYTRAPPPPVEQKLAISPVVVAEKNEPKTEPALSQEKPSDDGLIASIMTSLNLDGTKDEKKEIATSPRKALKISANTKEALNNGAAPISISKVRFWEAKQGGSLRDTLEQWSNKANTTLVWNASEDYMIKSNILVNDTFQNAIQRVFIKVLEDPMGPSLELISQAGSAAPSQLVISDRS